MVAVHGAPKPPPTRLTLTLPAIQAARDVWIIASGAEKASAVRLALSGSGPVQVPAAGARGTAADAVPGRPGRRRPGAGRDRRPQLVRLNRLSGGAIPPFGCGARLSGHFAGLVLARISACPLSSARLRLRPRARRDHLVVCGGDSLAFRMVEELTVRYGERVTVILPSADRGLRPAAGPAARRPDHRAGRAGPGGAAGGRPGQRPRAWPCWPRTTWATSTPRCAPRRSTRPCGWSSRSSTPAWATRIRTFFTDCAVLSESAMAAPAFVAAALGEPAPSHVRLAGRHAVRGPPRGRQRGRHRLRAGRRPGRRPARPAARRPGQRPGAGRGQRHAARPAGPPAAAPAAGRLAAWSGRCSGTGWASCSSAWSACWWPGSRCWPRPGTSRWPTPCTSPCWTRPGRR